VSLIANVGAPARLNVNGDLENHNLVNLVSNSTFGHDATLTITGALTNLATGILRSGSGADGPRSVNGTVANDGQIALLEDLTINTLGGTLAHSGTMDIPVGFTLSIPGGNLQLDGGSAQGDGTLSLTNVAVVGNGEMLVRTSGNAGTDVSAAGGDLGLGNAAAANGVSIGGSLDVGAVNVTLYDSNSPTIGGPITISGGTLVASMGLSVTNGLSGFGTVESDLTNNSSITVGAPTGILNVVGNYVQSASGVLNIELGGPDPGTGFDQINQSGIVTSASLDGTLNLNLTGGYIPPPGSTFEILTTNARAGNFATVTGTSLPCDEQAALDYGPFSVTVSVSGGCDDGDACTDNVCDTETESCDYPLNYNPATDCCDSTSGETTSIDDGSVCTQDVCNPDGSVDHIDLTPEGFCCNAETGQLTFIDDENECTEDTCNFDGTVDHVDNTPPDQCCNPANGDLTSIDDSLDCTDDVCNPDGSVDHNDTCEPGLSCYPQINECFTPVIASIQGTGLRELTINLAGGAMQEYALRITGDPGNPDVDCVSGYIQLDGLLGPEPVALTIADWGTEIVLEDETIIPTATYWLDIEGFLPPDSTSGATWPWGDVDGNLNVNFEDILNVVLGFQLMPILPEEDLDLEPCGGNGIVNFADVLIDVFAFQGQTYAASGCAVPCP
ncbi:MAG: hypothetical protein ACYTHJ_19800, partial [Planctomycetota bacterium]